MKVKLLKKVRKEYKINYREKPYKTLSMPYFSVPNIKKEEIEAYNIELDNIRKQCYFNYQLIIPNRRLFLFGGRFDDMFLKRYCTSINDAKEHVIHDLREHYPNLGNYNRQRKIKEKEHKVWYNGL